MLWLSKASAREEEIDHPISQVIPNIARHKSYKALQGHYNIQSGSDDGIPFLIKRIANQNYSSVTLPYVVASSKGTNLLEDGIQLGSMTCLMYFDYKLKLKITISFLTSIHYFSLGLKIIYF